MTRDKRWQAKFSGFVSRWKQFLSLKNCRSVRICSVLNRSNRDTTVYYRLIFCPFSWPNMVKWHHSGIISILNVPQNLPNNLTKGLVDCKELLTEGCLMTRRQNRFVLMPLRQINALQCAVAGLYLSLFVIKWLSFFPTTTSFIF